MQQKKTEILAILLLSMVMLLLFSCCDGQYGAPALFPAAALAEGAAPAALQSGSVTAANVEGKVYTFGTDNAYRFSAAEGVASTDAQTYGRFSISGMELTAEPETENGVASFRVPQGQVSIQYTYSDALLNAANEEWHLIDDNIASVDVFRIANNIQKGAIILQKSMDHMNWYNLSVQSNVFRNTPVQNGILYETTDMEMINGCYYRLIVVYELARKVGTSTVALVIPKDDMEYKRIAEVYEFYVANQNEQIEPLAPNTKRYALGETVLVSDFASYAGEREISKGDLHYGWQLGNFFVSGFTSADSSGENVVFLKNAGDVVTLWFNLAQNISALNHDGSLSITSDYDGHDRYFQTPTTNFGKGMLIIRYTDHENVKHAPVMYYDYLLANTLMGANTRVQLFEEGDYEVALDYEVTKSQLIPQTHHYRIFFRFSVRNANCMVYPFDVVTGAELTDRSVTEHGFRLDLARSRYLNLNIKKEVWAEGADGLTEDVRLNTTAKDGDCYTEEGIYTITAKNPYTGTETTKRIYVGTNRILAAYASSNYSIPEIQRMVAQGATIYEDGTIFMADSSEPTAATEPAEPLQTETAQASAESGGKAQGSLVMAAMVCVTVAALAFIAIRTSLKRSKEGKK